METVPRLYKRFAAGPTIAAASICSSMSRSEPRDIVTKSGLMLGIGETID